MIKKTKVLIAKIIYQLKMLKHRPKLLWNSAYVREDEFDKSLDINMYAILDMNKNDRKKHMENLCRRRQIAHERDLKKDSPLIRINVGKDFNQYLDRQNHSKNSYTGKKFREKFLKLLDNEEAWNESNVVIELDFLFVKRISPSWVNEAFAYFNKYASKEKIMTKIKFTNISQTKMNIIKHEIESGYYGGAVYGSQNNIYN